MCGEGLGTRLASIISLILRLLVPFRYFSTRIPLKSHSHTSPKPFRYVTKNLGWSQNEAISMRLLQRGSIVLNSLQNMRSQFCNNPHTNDSGMYHPLLSSGPWKKATCISIFGSLSKKDLIATAG